MTRIRFSFARLAELKYLSHLDMMRLFHRAFRRSGLPLAYSRGFNPHPRFNLAAPLPVEVTAAGEQGEVYFDGPVDAQEFLSMLRPQLPAGLELTGAVKVNPEEPSLPSLVAAALYRAVPENFSAETIKPEAMVAAVEALLAKKEIMVSRSGKKGKKKYVDVRPNIIKINVEVIKDTLPWLDLLLKTGSRGGVAPGSVLSLLEQELGSAWPQTAYWQIHREELFIEDGESLQSLPKGI